MLAFVAHMDDDTALALYTTALKPAVEAVNLAHTHMYAPVGQAEAAIELLDAVLQQYRAPLRNNTSSKAPEL